jgi:hypothetical protein
MLADLPSLPVGRTDANGKSPPTQTDAVTQSQNRRFRSVTFCCQQGGHWSVKLIVIALPLDLNSNVQAAFW